MANKRIKDLTQTATTLASDDYVAIDGSSNGTRKIVKGDLVNDISSQVAGTYLDEANNLSDVASLDTSKLNLEVPDVGTAPNEVPLNGMLGDMAYQSSDGVSVAELEVESTTGTATTQALTVTDGTNTNFVVQEDGKVGIGGNPSTTNPLRVSSSDATTPQALIQSNTSTGDAALSFNVSGRTFSLGIDKSDSEKFKISRSSELGNTDYVTIDGGNVGINQGYPSSFNGDADDLVVGDGSGSRGVSIVAGAGSNSTIFFADGAAGAAAYQGRVQYNHLANELRFGTGSLIRWKVDSSGNLVSYNGLYGIDFGSGATLDEYEVGTWTPAYTTTGSGFTTPPTMEVHNARYVRIGDLVKFYCHIQTDSVDLTGAGTYLLVNGLPYAATVSSGYNSVAINVGYAANWSNAPAGGYVDHGQSYIYLTKRTASITGNLSEMSPSDLTAGTVANRNTLMISGSYYTNA